MTETTGNLVATRTIRSSRSRTSVLAALGMYALALTVRGPGMVGNALANADAAQAAVLGQTLARGHSGPVHLFSDSYFGTVVADALLSHVSGYYTFLGYMEPLAFLAAVALLVGTVYRAVGLIPATVTLLMGACVSADALVYVIPQTEHATAVITAVILGALIAVIDRMPRAWWQWCLVILAVTIVGVNLASDPLIYVIGLAPFGATPIAVRALRSQRGFGQLFRRTLSVTLAILAVDALATFMFRMVGLDVLPPGGGGGALAPLADDPHHLSLAVNSVLRINGATTGSAPAWTTTLFAITAWTLSAAITVLVVRTVVDQAVRVRTGEAGLDQARVRICTFWMLSAALITAAVVVTTFAEDSSALRYITVLIPATAVLVALATEHPGRWRIAGVTIALSLATVNAAGVALTSPSNADSSSLAAVASALRARGLTHGYSSYWDAAALTAESRGAVTIRPIMSNAACNGGSGTLCRYTAITADSWYVASPGPSFVIVRPGGVCLNHPPGQPLYGTPQTFTVGPATIYVYPYDVAARFTKPSFAFCPPMLAKT